MAYITTREADATKKCVEFVAVACSCSAKVLGPGSPVFISPKFHNTSSIWKLWLKSHSLDMTLQIQSTLWAPKFTIILFIL